MSSNHHLLHCSQQHHQEQMQRSLFESVNSDDLNMAQEHQSLMLAEKDDYQQGEGENGECYSPEYYMSPQFNMHEQNYGASAAMSATYVRAVPQPYSHYAYPTQCMQQQDQPKHQEQQKQQVPWYPYCLPKTNYLVPPNVGYHYANNVYQQQLQQQQQQQQQQQPAQNHLYNHCHQFVHENARMPVIIQQGNNSRPPLTVQTEVIYHYYSLGGNEKVSREPVDSNKYDGNCRLIIETDEDDDNEYIYKVDRPSMFVGCGQEFVSTSPTSTSPSSPPDLEFRSSPSGLFQSASYFLPASFSDTLYEVNGKFFTPIVENTSSCHDRCSTRDTDYNRSTVEIEEIVDDKPLPSVSSTSLASPSKEEAASSGASSKKQSHKVKPEVSPRNRNYLVGGKKVSKKLRKSRKCPPNNLYLSVNCKRQESVPICPKKPEEVHNNRDFEVRPSAYMAKEGYLVEEPVDDEPDVTTNSTC